MKNSTLVELPQVNLIYVNSYIVSTYYGSFTPYFALPKGGVQKNLHTSFSSTKLDLKAFSTKNVREACCSTSRGVYKLYNHMKVEISVALTAYGCFVCLLFSIHCLYT